MSYARYVLAGVLSLLALAMVVLLAQHLWAGEASGAEAGAGGAKVPPSSPAGEDAEAVTK